MNDIDEFKFGYGKKNEETVIFKYDNIAAAATVLKAGRKLNFTRYIKFNIDYQKFMEDFNQTKREAECGKDYYKILDLDNMNKIQVTCIPWKRFTNFKDAINYSQKSSKPKICLGKYYMLNDEYYIDFSILVNHAFQDGYQIAVFLNNLQEHISKIRIDSKEKIYEKRR